MIFFFFRCMKHSHNIFHSAVGQQFLDRVVQDEGCHRHIDVNHRDLGGVL